MNESPTKPPVKILVGVVMVLGISIAAFMLAGDGVVGSLIVIGAVAWVMACIVVAIAQRKGFQGGPWAVYGFFLWPVALVHVLLKPKPQEIEDREAFAAGTKKRCPACAEVIQAEARKCRYCGEVFDLTPQA